MSEKILLIYGGGAIGSYTSEELLKRGFEVDVITYEAGKPSANIKYYTGNYTNEDVHNFLADKYYDAIVDFRHFWADDNYDEELAFLAPKTDHIVFLSSYRVYSDKEHPIVETTPQLIDTVTDKEYLNTYHDYALDKCRVEKIIARSEYSAKVTIVRPLISFYHGNLSFICTPGSILAYRVLNGKKILVPKEAQEVYAGYCFAGNTGKLLAHLVLNPKAYGESYTLGSGECLTWGEIGKYFEEFLGAEFVWVDKETWLKHASANPAGDRIGLDYDRLLDRRIDASKVLEATGLSKGDLISVCDAIRMTTDTIKGDEKVRERLFINANKELDEKIDKYFLHLHENRKDV